LTKRKLYAFAAALIFLFHPAHSENAYWFSTISVTLSTVFIIFATISYYRFRKKNSIISFAVALILSALAFLAYEQAIIIPLLLLAMDIFLIKPKNRKRSYLALIPFFALLPVYFIIRQTAHAFSGGGNYAYNLSLVIPNVFGNIFGYIGLFLAGESFLPLYNQLRANLAENIMLFAAIFILILASSGFMLIKYKHKIKGLIRQNGTIIFLITYGLISLLPYLPLGNIAPRYMYLASSPFSIALILVLLKITSMVIKNPKKAAYTFQTILIALLAVYYYLTVSASMQWAIAGNITRNMLTDFRLKYEDLGSTTDLYFMNVPVKHENAWVYPVGLEDSLWFIYRENLPGITQIGSIEEARSRAVKTHKNYLIELDDQGHIQRTEL
jgi:hypothetical protein